MSLFEGALTFSWHSVRETVRKEPLAHVALISFGIAALLFLVTEELLLEAHEAQEHSAHEEHIWWVDMFFFLGFLLSFLMDKLLDTD